MSRTRRDGAGWGEVEGGREGQGWEDCCCCCCCTITKRIRTAPNPSTVLQACTPTSKPKQDGFPKQHVPSPKAGWPPSPLLVCPYHRTRPRLTSSDSFVDCSPSWRNATGAQSALALINTSKQSFPTGDPQQTITHLSCYHLGSSHW